MLRLLFAWLLLLNYLLVVTAGLCVIRPAVEVRTALRSYVHSKTCQRDYALRLDCFDRCNGEQGRHVAAKLPSGSGLHFLAQLKGLDVHCTAGLEVVDCMVGWHAWVMELRYESVRNAAVARGFGYREYPPPRNG